MRAYLKELFDKILPSFEGLTQVVYIESGPHAAIVGRTIYKRMK